jgi:hypothetical protein
MEMEDVCMLESSPLLLLLLPVHSPQKRSSISTFFDQRCRAFHRYNDNLMK